MVSAALLRSIHRLEDLPRLAAALGYQPLWRELPDTALGDTTASAIVGGSGEFQWYGIQAGDGVSARAARALAARGVPAAVFGLDEASRRLTVAAGTSAPTTLLLETPDPLHLSRLRRTAFRPGESPLATAFRVAESLAGQAIDQRFFAGFRRVLDATIAAMPARIPALDRHALGLLLLTRILFLYFVEAKGWLDARPRFLREEVDRCLLARRSLHKDLLHPLFFGTLNRPAAERGRLASRYGNIPFLNGGLFEPHPLERRWRTTLPTPLLRDAFDTLFDRFHFTLATPSGEAIAPDMLGRVFEGVMEPEERHGTGSYYTPAALVDGVLRDGLTTWLTQRLRVPWSDAAARLDAPDASTHELLATVRLLDPAVGSGAFLLGALRLLAGPDRQGGRSRSAALRRVLRSGLFGVDRNAAAVRLAELRLWLEVVAADRSERPASVVPLPNLDALIRQGDSLLDPAAGLPQRPASAARAAELTRLRRAAVGAAGAEKRLALAALRRAERDLAEEALRHAVATLDHQVRELLAAASGPTLFAERRGFSREDRIALGELRAARRRARERLRALSRSGEVPWFDYATQFADVLSAGGFDLVVGNPPWVRAEALSPEVRLVLAERYRWFRSARQGVRGYAHRPDVSVAFLERALELTAPGGAVAFLLPAKLATAGYATALRSGLSRRTTIGLAADLREDPRAMFDATVYPMALVAVNAPPDPGHRIRTELGSGTEGRLQAGLSGEAWPLGAGPAGEFLERVGARFPRLGEQFVCQLGVKTGYNRAFLDPGSGVEEGCVRWAVRGRDVAPFRVARVRRLLWPCTASGQPLPVLPPGAARHLASFLPELRRRADYPGGKPWILFRTGAAVAPHRVLWSDVARRLEAVPQSGRAATACIPLNSCYVTVVPDSATAQRLAAWLNSTWCRAMAAAIAEPAAGGFARFNARVVASLPLPPAALKSPDLLTLARLGLSRTLSQDDLDDHCADLLQLTVPERALLVRLAGAGAHAGR